MKFTLKTGLMLALLPLLSSSAALLANKKNGCCLTQKSLSAISGNVSFETPFLPANPIAISPHGNCVAVITNNEPEFEPGTGILSIYGFNDDCCNFFLHSQNKALLPTTSQQRQSDFLQMANYLQ